MNEQLAEEIRIEKIILEKQNELEKISENIKLLREKLRKEELLYKFIKNDIQLYKNAREGVNF
jgi:uroporphyrinogen-III decarboxylase